MAVRSVLQIDVDDSRFKAFQALYMKYQDALKRAPAIWEQVEKQIDGSSEAFDKLVGRMAAARIESERRERAEEHLNRLTYSSAERWQSLSRSSREFARNIGEATVSLLRWASVTGVISGLVGAGGLFGVDRLALAAAGQRRSALGLGANIGEQQAFGANFSRLVDPDAFISGVARARMDVTQRTGLLAAGLSQKELGGSAGETAVALLRNLSRLADKWDPRLFAQYIQAYQLGNVVSPEDLQRLRSTPAAERERLFRQYGEDRGRFALPGDTAARWQEFVTQLTRAGTSIEQTLIKGLVPLSDPLTKLSHAAEELIQTFLKSDTLKVWISGMTEALKEFTGYVGTPAFRQNVSDFVQGVGSLASSVVSALKFFGVIPNPAFPGEIQVPRTSLTGFREPVNNPGNLRPPGSVTGFQHFETPETGLRAMAAQIQRYEMRDHLDTLEKVLTKYAPPEENDTAGYIRDVARKTGISPTQKLDPGDRAELARIVAAMVSREQGPGHYDRYKDAKVVVEILNRTGDNVNVSANGLKQ